MSKAPKYWAKAKKILSKKDKVMKKLIYKYKDGNLITRNDVFFHFVKVLLDNKLVWLPPILFYLEYKKNVKIKLLQR